MLNCNHGDYATVIYMQLFMVSGFGWPVANTGFEQSEYALYTCYFIIMDIGRHKIFGF